ncbi:MAG: PASTA domain-containing protein, partial [Candidatus Nanopelagicales bacterium]
PPSQETVDAGTPVDIVVSNGKVKVPNVVGSSEAQAQSDLRNAGFDVEVIQLETSNQPEGTVLAQSPQAGTVAVRGTLVTITVAKAPPPPTESPTPPPSDTPTPSVSPTP